MVHKKKVSIYFGALILVLVVLVPSVYLFPNDYHVTKEFIPYEVIYY